MKPCSDSLHTSGVKKRAWTEREDTLLRNCIQKYGEGKWHQVPQRAGLNRCRKSCRLRWLNYLHPEIKRGDFSPEETDLIMKMHKLLGNRWSMIAARLSRRTANDIKNHWNSHINRKRIIPSSPELNMVNKHQNNIEIIPAKVKPIKPQPHRLSKNFKWEDVSITLDDQGVQSGEFPYKPTLVEFKQDQNMEWWESTSFQNNGWNDSFFTRDFGEDFGITSYLEEYQVGIPNEESNTNMESMIQWTDLCVSFDLWQKDNTTMGTM